MALQGQDTVNGFCISVKSLKQREESGPSQKSAFYPYFQKLITFSGSCMFNGIFSSAPSLQQA